MTSAFPAGRRRRDDSRRSEGGESRLHRRTSRPTPRGRLQTAAGDRFSSHLTTRIPADRPALSMMGTTALASRRASERTVWPLMLKRRLSECRIAAERV